MNQQLKKIMIVVLLLAVSAVAALGLRAWLHPPLKLQAAELLPLAKSMEGYGLTLDNAFVNFDILKGHYVLLFFGYTSCADVCPLELQKLGKVLKQFDDLEAKKKPLVLFVSVDPERDKPEMLKTYTQYFHRDMVGITGRNDELARLAAFFAVAYNRTTTIAGKEYLIQAGADMPSGSDKHYVVNHSSRIFILDPQLRYIGSFAPPHDAVILFSDIQQLVKQ